MRSASSPRAVSMMTGMPPSTCRARMAWHTSSPSMPGSIRSRITRSGIAARSRGITCVPDVTA